MSPVDRLLLVRHGTTSDTRAGRFPATAGSSAVDGCAPLDRRGLEDAAALHGHLPTPDHVWSSLAVRTRQTAAQAGFDPAPTAVLAECDFGRWAGKDPRTIHGEDPDGLAAWYAGLASGTAGAQRRRCSPVPGVAVAQRPPSDPDDPPHGGEGLAAVQARARRLLDEAGALGGTVLAFTHGGLIRAVLMEALGLPPSVFWAVDVAPASVTEVHLFGGSTARLTRLNWTPRLSGAAVTAPSGSMAPVMP